MKPTDVWQCEKQSEKVLLGLRLKKIHCLWSSLEEERVEIAADFACFYHGFSLPAVSFYTNRTQSATDLVHYYFCNSDSSKILNHELHTFHHEQWRHKHFVWLYGRVAIQRGECGSEQRFLLVPFHGWHHPHYLSSFLLGNRLLWISIKTRHLPETISSWSINNQRQMITRLSGRKPTKSHPLPRKPETERTASIKSPRKSPRYLLRTNLRNALCWPTTFTCTYLDETVSETQAYCWSWLTIFVPYVFLNSFL